jgi:predicted ATP-dependent endonuclease of OLD family
MKLVSVSIKNVKSFKENTNISFDNKFNVLIGSNGSGKSNLLDIITISLRKFLLFSYEIDSTGGRITINRSSGLKKIDEMLEKFIEDTTESHIKIKIKVDKKDIDNIQILKKYSKDFKKALKSNYDTNSLYYSEIVEHLDRLDYLTPEIIQLNQEFDFSITNNELDEVNSYRLRYDYLTYLNSLELCLILAKDIGDIGLSPIYLYFSPYRAESNLNEQVNLAANSFYELLADYLESSSKTTASIIKLASLYFARKKRVYEHKASTGKEDRSTWNNDKQVKKITKILEKIGFSWDLRLRNADKNIYEIILTKQGKEFSLTQISSGEKEIINFLLGIFALNIEGGLLIIDEPELHLHPKWQILFLDILIELARITNNQFILSTHSVSFINKNTISNVIRVYRNTKSSNVVTINRSNLMDAKDLLHIINSYNNEKIFFADKVVLVEGKSDKLIFEKLINYYLSLHDKTEVIEVIEVDGKSNLKKYRTFLESFSIENYIIADLDYAKTIGNETIKKMFLPNTKRVIEEVATRPSKSRDGQALLKMLERALASENLEDYREDISNVFKYIKSRNTKIKDNLSIEEENVLFEFIDNQTNEKIYILRKGEIEDYLPHGFNTLQKIVSLVEDEVFHAKFLNFSLESNFDERRKELNKIVFDILGIEQIGDRPPIKRIERVEAQVKKGSILTKLLNIIIPIFLLLRYLLIEVWSFFRKRPYISELIIGGLAIFLACLVFLILTSLFTSLLPNK